MKSFFGKFKRNLFKKALTVFSLSATAFVFQACYGMPNDDSIQACFEGCVLDSDSNEPLQGIEVKIDGYNGVHYTDADGKYQLYIPVQSTYTIRFTDIDNTENGLYDEQSVIVEHSDTVVCYTASVSLEKVQ